MTPRSRFPPAPLGVSAHWTVVTATASTTLAIIPSALVGGLAFLMVRDLHFGEGRLGAAAAVFFAATAIGSVPGGRVAERMGAVRAMQLGAVGSAVCLLGISLLVSRWGHLAGFLVIGGLSNGLAQPAGNLALASGVAHGRQGLAFGVKQSAIPVAGLLTGLSVPLLALVVGWRPVFSVVAAAGLVLALLLPRLRSASGSPRSAPAPRPDARAGALVLLAAGCCLGTAAALSLSTFLVGYLQSVGVPAAAAGSLLAVGGVASVLVRLVSGWVADHRVHGSLTSVGAALLLGAAAYAGLASGTSDTAAVVCLVAVAFGFGWGWPALFALTVVRLNPTAPGAATGVTQAGGALGGVLGPLTFGTVVVHGSYAAAWSCAAAAAAMSAVLMLVSARRLGRAAAGPAQVSAGPQVPR